MVGEIILTVIASLYMLVAIYYFCSGLLFSRLLLNMGSLFSGKNVAKFMIYNDTISDNVDEMGKQLMPTINPVLSSVIKNGVLKSYILILIGLILGFIAVVLAVQFTWILGLIGLLGVCFFSLLEIILGIFFYLPKDKLTTPKGTSGIIHIVLHLMIGIIAVVGYCLFLYL